MNINNKLHLAIALVIMTFLGAVGGAVLNRQSTSAQDTNTTQPTTNSQLDPTKGAHVGANGVKEDLLTGDVAEKVKAAALEAVSDGSIQRVETDAEGSPYEAHMTKSDGSKVTVKVDSNFKVTSVETGTRKI